MMTNETVLMRLTGHQAAFRLTEVAHHALLEYLADARHELAQDPDGDESVRDLEVSIGDHLLTLGDTPIDDDQMRSTLEMLGPVASENGEQVASDHGDGSRRWRRILDGRWLTGVCLGVSAATESSVSWVRAIYVGVTLVIGALLAPFSNFVMLAFFGLSVLTYLALSLFLPPVGSLAEYRRLRDHDRGRG